MLGWSEAWRADLWPEGFNWGLGRLIWMLRRLNSDLEELISGLRGRILGLGGLIQAWLGWYVALKGWIEASGLEGGYMNGWKDVCTVCMEFCPFYRTLVLWGRCLKVFGDKGQILENDILKFVAWMHHIWFPTCRGLNLKIEPCRQYSCCQ